MKVLGWFHNKFKHNSTASLKTSTEPHSLLECLGHHDVEFKRFPTDVRLENDEDMKNEGFANELFPGFLAIGTLGGDLDLINTEPPTPTFPYILEESINEEHKITENELKLISTKLEEFFEAEETANQTSARSSYASVITLSNDQTEDTYTEDQIYMATCPLQKYLFGSSLELRETEMPIKKGGNPLGKLFKRNTDHSHHEEIQEHKEKQGKERATNFLKKMLKKIHPVSVSTKTPPRDAGHGSLLRRKLPKVCKLFHRKVHPEGSMTQKESSKSCNKSLQESFSKSGYQGGRCEESTIFAPSTNSAMLTSNQELFSKTVPPAANREHWIKTDTEYVVLEL